MRFTMRRTLGDREHKYVDPTRNGNSYLWLFTGIHVKLYGLRARAIGLYEQTWYGIYE